MTRRPFDTRELEGLDPDLEPTLADLDRYLADTLDNPSSSFADHVMAAVEQEPMPRRGAIGALVAWFAAPGGSARLTLLVATAVVAVLAVVALGRIGDLLPANVGTSSPSFQGSPSPEPSPSLRPTPSPTPRETRTPRPSRQPSASPEASDDHGGDASETAEPSDDHSGSGGGDGGNSGPGSSDDSSGSGSSGSGK